MTSERTRFLGLTALVAIAVYLLDGPMTAWLGSGMTRAVELLLALATAASAPLLRGEWRLAQRPWIDALRADLAIQTSAQGVAGVLVTHVHRLAGARAVVLYLGEARPAAMFGEPQGEPTLVRTLMASERPFGEVHCHGVLRNEAMVDQVLRVGALALQNALLAEQAAAAERAHLQAQAQRDLQYRLTWTVTTQLCALLEETRIHLETVRLCARTMPPDLLTRDLDLLSERLKQLEAFVQDNLRNANAGQELVSPLALARSSRPR